MKVVTLGSEELERLVLGLPVEVDGIQVQIGEENSPAGILAAAERALKEFDGIETLSYKELKAFG